MKEITAELRGSPRQLLGYAEAKKKRSLFSNEDMSEEVVVSVVALEGLEIYGHARNYGVRFSNDGVSRRLSVIELQGELVGIDLDVRSESNPLLERITSTLGVEVIADLMPILSGQFEDEDELDDAISDIWQKFAGTSNELVATLLLDEAHSQALSTKELTEMGSKFNLRQPSHEDLIEFQSLLGDIQA